MAGLLAACAGETARSGSLATTSGNSQEATECSLIGRLACRAMALGADGQQASCTAARSGATYIETCGAASTTLATPSTAPAPAKAPPAASASAPRSTVRLTWTDNSSDETGFVIERCDPTVDAPRVAQAMVSCGGAWRIIANLPANATSYLDNTVLANQTYIYRVKAINPSGSSPYSAEAVITAPEK